MIAKGSTVHLGGGDVAQVAHLGPAVAAAFGINLSSDYVSRRDAMTIPSVRRGRGIIAGTIGTLPLQGVRVDSSGAETAIERALLRQPDPDATRQFVLTWTVDDLLFHGIAWWRVTARDFQGFPTSAKWVPHGRVVPDFVNGTVRMDGVEVPNSDVIRFDGPDEGLLRTSGRMLRTCILLEEAVRRFARLDIPLGVFTPQPGAPELSPTQIGELLDEWEAARADRTTGYVNQSLKWDPVQFNAEQLQLADQLAFMDAAVARALNLPARYVGAKSGDSMTYSTVEADRRELLDLSLAPYVTAIDQRLSMDDVTPRGQLARVDTLPLLRGDMLNALKAGQIAMELGVMSDREVRNDLVGRAGEPPARPPAPQPAVPAFPQQQPQQPAFYPSVREDR